MAMDDRAIIERLKDKYKDKNTEGFTILDFISACGSPVEAIAYSKLFWPDFVKFHNMVFLSDTLETAADRDRVIEGFQKYGLDRRTTEEAFNVLEIPNFFARHGGESTDEEDIYLAERIAEMWRHRLAQQFPHRQFVVQVVDAEDVEIGVTFYQK